MCIDELLRLFVCCFGDFKFFIFICWRTYSLQASRQAEYSPTCIQVPSPVLRVYLCLLFGFSPIKAVIFWMCPPTPYGSYLDFPPISMGNCEIHLERIEELQVPVFCLKLQGTQHSFNIHTQQRFGILVFHMTKCR